ncbi:MAG: methyl-accepting chemotaxis protein [Synergistaceae bacterium]|jgi:methyl-accepting chemotaxis protein|nr:methyl-accepting chemotaxis protein [Synergistaceae bacterium]
MWKNLKISFKLLLGFGLLLAVFVGAVVVTWENLTVVKEGGEELSKVIVNVMQDTSNLERDTYEYLLSFRQMQYKTTEANFINVKAKEAAVQKDIDAILGFGASHPALQSPKYVQDKFVGPFKKFTDAVDKTIAAVKKKDERDRALAAQGQTLFKSADELVASYAKAALDSVEAFDVNTVEKRLERYQKSVDFLLTLQTLRREVQRAWFTNDFRTMRETLRKFPIPPLEKELTALRNSSQDAERINLMGQLLEMLPDYAASLEDFVQAQEVFEEQIRICQSLEQVINNESSNTSAIARKRVSEISSESVGQTSSVIMVLFLSAVTSIVLGVLVAILISRSISTPLHTLVALARRSGEGDLTIEREEFCYEGRDELGELADVLAAMIARQEESLQEVVNVADNLSSSAQALSAISEETNASMNEVKTSIERVSSLSENNGAALEECNAGVEEMSAGADTVAQSATDSAAFISQTADTSNKAIQTVNGVIAGMHNVDANAKESENKTRQLVASVENVSSFVSVITGIADQTNLLALNAAIEAARAGEVGRGFAVVAEAVRKLAEESARAAQNVNAIIVELQHNAQESIEATTEAGRMLAETLAQAEQAQTELNGALREMNKANDSIQNIAAVAEEQAASSKEVATAIDSATRSTMEMVETISNIRRATEDTTQAARGVAEQSDTMNEHARTLSEVLSHFTLSASPSRKVLPAPKAPEKRPGDGAPVLLRRSDAASAEYHKG